MLRRPRPSGYRRTHTRPPTSTANIRCLSSPPHHSLPALPLHRASALLCRVLAARPSRAVPPLPLIGLPPRSRIARAFSSPSAQNQTPPSAPIIGLSPNPHTKYPQLPAQPSLHAHSWTTRQPSSARQQSHSAPPGRRVCPISGPACPQCSARRRGSRCSLQSQHACRISRTAASPLPRLRAHLQPSLNPSPCVCLCNAPISRLFACDSVLPPAPAKS
jgi:hypothetical protein